MNNTNKKPSTFVNGFSFGSFELNDTNSKRLSFTDFSLHFYYSIKKHSLQQKMQKVPINFITAMQSKRLQNCNRYKMIYFIHIALFSPADAQFTLKLRRKRKALLQHQILAFKRLFPAHGNKTSLFALLHLLLHFRGPYRRIEAVHLRKLLFFTL